MELENILKELCKYMNENEDNMNSYEWNILYNAKENIKKIVKGE